MNMLSREWIEKFDASYGIPRKANEQYLPSYQAFWQWSADIGMCLFLGFLGVIASVFCWYAGVLLNVYGLITLVFWALALICIAGSLVDAYFTYVGVSGSKDEYCPWFGENGLRRLI